MKTYFAISSQSAPVTPFQYYTEPGEKITKTLSFTHTGCVIRYSHYLADGTVIAHISITDPARSLIDGESQFAETDNTDTTEVDFASLLAEFHLVSLGAGQTYSPPDLESLQSLFPKQPILIGGCGRSGTTLLLAVLGAHPEIFALEEEMYAFYPLPFRLKSLTATLRNKALGNSWTRWCEKTPKNVRAFGFIHAAFGGKVKLIHMVRDGRDVITSHHPNAADRYYVSPQRWVSDVKAGLEHRDKSLLVRYEDLVSSPESTLHEICDYLELEYHPRLIDYSLHSTVRENKAWEGRAAKPLNADRLGRWQTPEHQKRIAELLGYPGVTELLNELGY